MLRTDNVSLLSSMFAIIYPVIWIPALTALFWLERRALKDNLINFEVARTGVDDTAVNVPAHVEEKTYWQRTVQVFQEVDTIGLLLLGFGWSLLLLPFALYSGADGGFSNRSLIAMLAIGPACLIAYPVYEWKFAKYPSMPKRILFNRTFVTSVIINFFCPFTLRALRPNESLTSVARTHRHARRVPPAALSQVRLHSPKRLCPDFADFIPLSCASLLFLALKTAQFLCLHRHGYRRDQVELCVVSQSYKALALDSPTILQTSTTCRTWVSAASLSSLACSSALRTVTRRGRSSASASALSATCAPVKPLRSCCRCADAAQSLAGSPGQQERRA